MFDININQNKQKLGVSNERILTIHSLEGCRKMLNVATSLKQYFELLKKEIILDMQMQSMEVKSKESQEKSIDSESSAPSEIFDLKLIHPRMPFLSTDELKKRENFIIFAFFLLKYDDNIIATDMGEMTSNSSMLIFKDILINNVSLNTVIQISLYMSLFMPRKEKKTLHVNEVDKENYKFIKVGDAEFVVENILNRDDTLFDFDFSIYPEYTIPDVLPKLSSNFKSLSYGDKSKPTTPKKGDKNADISIAQFFGHKIKKYKFACFNVLILPVMLENKYKKFVANVKNDSELALMCISFEGQCLNVHLTTKSFISMPTISFNLEQVCIDISTSSDKEVEVKIENGSMIRIYFSSAESAHSFITYSHNYRDCLKKWGVNLDVNIHDDTAISVMDKLLDDNSLVWKMLTDVPLQLSNI